MCRRFVCLLLSLFLLCSALPARAAGGFSDVPSGSWAEEYINSARGYGLISGVSQTEFGYGQDILRRDFVIILCRMFGWELKNPAVSSFSDVSPDSYYFTYVETALAQGVFAKTAAFEPERAITREEMAVMLVRALGLGYLATQVEDYGHGFSDVTANAGFITIAADIGMISGMGDGTFAPKATAKREHAAAMLVRVYERYRSNTEWLHGFYAFSSYSQRYVTRQMDAVSLGWSTLCFDDSGVWLNTGGTGGNERRIPAAFDSITTYLDEGATPANLDVYMDMTARVSEGGVYTPALRALLANETRRSEAVTAIIAEATRKYEVTGKSPYAGVTIDFEGLREQDKDGFTAFLRELSARTRERGLTLFVAVQPAVFGDQYFDGYDFSAIGRLADKVILMAHDYHPTSLETSLIGSSWQNNTPLTPMSKVYYALKAITDPQSGVEDTSKIALAISFSTVGWRLDANGKIADVAPISPTVETVGLRLRQADTLTGWSDTYRNPYITYQVNGERYFLWYENERSVAEKVALARLFGITGLSVWRIGIIPDYQDGYDVWSVIAAR